MAKALKEPGKDLTITFLTRTAHAYITLCDCDDRKLHFSSAYSLDILGTMP